MQAKISKQKSHNSYIRAMGFHILNKLGSSLSDHYQLLMINQQTLP